MSVEVFHGDRPVQAPDEDRFGFDPLAERIAGSVTAQAAGKGFVLGIEGKWGSGKSSLLALTLQHLRKMPPDQVATVEFRPWLVGDRDQLLTALFEDLAKAIAKVEQERGKGAASAKLVASDVAVKVRKFATHLSPIGKLAGAAGILLPGASLAGSIIEKIAEAAGQEPHGPTLADQKEDLSNALLKLNCRIVVTIDDVDRLEPTEVAELLRLVRSVADFPNISYVLCYDAEMLGRSIEQATSLPNGAAYLEKIVQTEVAVPQPESFALRRWFSSELQTFATCREERVRSLQRVIDETGGRVFKNPRVVVRVLDSLRVYWPSLKGRVDLSDLVWLRMVAVSAPNLYRWLEEYLIAYAALAGGRVHISDEQRTAMTSRLDDALKLDGVEWSQLQFELDEHLPGVETFGFNHEKDGRLFSRAGDDSLFKNARDQRLASPSHSRLYFSLVEPPDSVNDSDIAELLKAAQDGANCVSFFLLKMGAQVGDTGATKAEKLLDQLRYVDGDVLQGWPIEALVLGIANAADALSQDTQGDDWGYPRIWYLAHTFLKHLTNTLSNSRSEQLIRTVFEQGASIGFVSYLLRDETFDHGFYGDRPKPHDCLLSREAFDAVRAAMIQKYANLGLDEILAEKFAATILYAWSQAGGRDDLVGRVRTQSARDWWFVSFLQHLFGRNSSLSLEALANFFDSPAGVVRRVMALAATDPPFPGAVDIVRSVKTSVEFFGGDLEQTLESWEERERVEAAATED